MYKLQSTEDSSTWLVVRIRSAEVAIPPFNKVLATNGVVKQQVQIKNILKTMAPYTTGAGSTPAVFRRQEGHVGKLRQCPAERLPEVAYSSPGQFVERMTVDDNHN